MMIFPCSWEILLSSSGLDQVRIHSSLSMMSK
jgi:hypothetical protein